MQKYDFTTFTPSSESERYKPMHNSSGSTWDWLHLPPWWPKDRKPGRLWAYKEYIRHLRRVSRPACRLCSRARRQLLWTLLHRLQSAHAGGSCPVHAWGIRPLPNVQVSFSVERFFKSGVNLRGVFWVWNFVIVRDAAWPTTVPVLHICTCTLIWNNSLILWNLTTGYIRPRLAQQKQYICPLGIIVLCVEEQRTTQTFGGIKKMELHWCV